MPSQQDLILLQLRRSLRFIRLLTFDEFMLANTSHLSHMATLRLIEHRWVLMRKAGPRATRAKVTIRRRQFIFFSLLNEACSYKEPEIAMVAHDSECERINERTQLTVISFGCITSVAYILSLTFFQLVLHKYSLVRLYMTKRLTGARGFSLTGKIRAPSIATKWFLYFFSWSEFTFMM